MSLRETLQNVRSLPDPQNEEAVKFRIVAPMLTGLGWETAGPEVHYEYVVGRGRVDFALGEASNIVSFIEAKAPRVNLNHHVEQVVRYAFHESVDICVLTDGLQWWLYLPMEPVRFEERRFAVLQIRKDPIDQLRDDLHQYLSRESMMSGEALRAARRRFLLDKAIPTAWQELLTGPDEALVELVRQRVSEHVDVLPTAEEVRERISLPPGSTPEPPTPPHPPKPPTPPDSSRKPIGYRLWGEFYPVRYGNEVLLGVAECLYGAHSDSFADRIQALSWASRNRRGDRWKEVGTTGIFLNVNYKVDKLIERSRELLDFFGHPSSELEIVYRGLGEARLDE